jgi:hypothetical protein
MSTKKLDRAVHDQVGVKSEGQLVAFSAPSRAASLFSNKRVVGFEFRL